MEVCIWGTPRLYGRTCAPELDLNISHLGQDTRQQACSSQGPDTTLPASSPKPSIQDIVLSQAARKDAEGGEATDTVERSRLSRSWWFLGIGEYPAPRRS